MASVTDKDVHVRLPQVLRAPFSFWTSPDPWRHVPSFYVAFPLRSLWTDASVCWGALLEPSQMVSGHWSPLENQLHVNVLEMRAVCRAVSFLSFVSLRTTRWSGSRWPRVAPAPQPSAANWCPCCRTCRSAPSIFRCYGYTQLST